MDKRGNWQFCLDVTKLCCWCSHGVTIRTGREFINVRVSVVTKREENRVFCFFVFFIGCGFEGGDWENVVLCVWFL